MSGDETAERIVAAALSWVGTPYRHQGRRKGVGCDCLGLVLGVWQEIYGGWPAKPPPYAPDWAEAGEADLFLEAAARYCRPRSQLARPLPGDLILFRWRRGHVAKHAGICVGADSFVHARQGSAVTVSPLLTGWRSRLAGVFEFPAPSTGRSGA